VLVLLQPMSFPFTTRASLLLFQQQLRLTKLLHLRHECMLLLLLLHHKTTMAHSCYPATKGTTMPCHTTDTVDDMHAYYNIKCLFATTEPATVKQRTCPSMPRQLLGPCICI
jgi:hypothetical protein